MAGQCAKLKCCLNYEVDAYVESQKRLPSKEITLETTEGTFYFFKADILKGLITYSSDKNFIANAVTIPARRAFEIINQNKRGEKPESLVDNNNKVDNKRPIDLVEQESLTRFDKKKQNTRKKKKKQNPKEGVVMANAPVKEPQPQENKAPNRNKHRNRRPNESREKQAGNNPKNKPNEKQPEKTTN